jgi:hypothetical protein
MPRPNGRPVPPPTPLTGLRPQQGLPGRKAAKTGSWARLTGGLARLTGGFQAVKDKPARPKWREVTPRLEEVGPPRPHYPRDNNRLRIAVIGVVVVLVAFIAYLFLKPGSSSPSAGTKPTATASTHAKAPAKKTTATKPPASHTTTGKQYTLSTPATAGGFPQGTDPDFLAQATTTAQSIVSAVSSGGGGTAHGSPVSASYRLPTGEQVMEFVGYQGSFTPAKVAAILKSLGSDPASYPAGSHGGVLGCANTPSSPSGAVCVWSTTSTLGVVEFFNVSGPETLTSSQAQGAALVVQLRSGVESAKS